MMIGGTLIAWVAVVFKGWHLWRYPSDPRAWTYWGGFVALALNLTLLLPAITRWIDRPAGVADLAYLTSDAVALLAC